MRHALTLALLSSLVACDEKIPEEGKIPLGAVGSEQGALTGTLLEQVAAPPYTYLRLKTSSGEAWAAVPEARLETGKEVTVFNAVAMSNFESTTLKRTFDRIWFGTLEAPAAAAAPGGDPHAGLGQAAPPFEVGKVDKAAGADGRTVAEVWAQKDRLAGKGVSIRGVVVKVNTGVMGKNWLHLRDGSGDAAAGTNDITVTTTDVAPQGETITITGTVRTNVDLGAGYWYPVMVEDARVVRTGTRM